MMSVTAPGGTESVDAILRVIAWRTSAGIYSDIHAHPPNMAPINGNPFGDPVRPEDMYEAHEAHEREVPWDALGAATAQLTELTD